MVQDVYIELVSKRYGSLYLKRIQRRVIALDNGLYTFRYNHQWVYARRNEKGQIVNFYMQQIYSHPYRSYRDIAA